MRLGGLGLGRARLSLGGGGGATYTPTPPVAPFEGARVGVAAQSIAEGTSTPIVFTGVQYDTAAYWSAGAPGRLTLPGACYVRPFAYCGWNAVSSAMLSRQVVTHQDSGGSTLASVAGDATVKGASPTGVIGASFDAGWLLGAAGDRFLLDVVKNTAGVIGAQDVNAQLGIEVVDVATFHGCRANRSASLTLATGTSTVVPLTAADSFDTDAFHDPGGGSPERVTIPPGLGGYYDVSAGVTWENVASDTLVAVWVRVNGSGDFQQYASRGSLAIAVPQNTSAGVLALAAGDYLEVWAVQASGGPQNVTAAWLSLSLRGT